MSTKHDDTDVRDSTIKNEFTRQRWELFHRAIAHAKQSNDSALKEDAVSSAKRRAGPALSIVK